MCSQDLCSFHPVVSSQLGLHTPQKIFQRGPTLKKMGVANRIIVSSLANQSFS
jgi:hypothetical protein